MEDLSQLIKNLMQSQAEQTHALIKAQMDQQSKLLKTISSVMAKANSVPAFEGFNKEKEEFSNYLSRLKQHFNSHAVTDAKDQKAKFLSWVGIETFELLKRIRPDFEGDCSFGQIEESLKIHFENNLHYIHSRVDFTRCLLKPDQSYRDWVAELRSIGQRCKFSCSNPNCGISNIDEQIRDAIIRRTPHKNIQAALLQLQDPTLEKVIGVAESMIRTSRTMDVIKSEEKDNEVFLVKNSNSNKYRSKWRSCKNCYSKHERKDCPHCNKICKICKLKGHIAEVL